MPCFSDWVPNDQHEDLSQLTQVRGDTVLELQGGSLRMLRREDDGSIDYQSVDLRTQFCREIISAICFFQHSLYVLKRLEGLCEHPVNIIE